MPGRSFNSPNYRYGFNGKENDNETVGTGEGTQDYGMRIYNPALGKFLSVDPLTKSYPMLTPYQFASNSPIQAIDLDGEEAKVVIVPHSDGKGNYDPMLGHPNEHRLYAEVARQVSYKMGITAEELNGSVVYIHTSPNGIEAISYTYIDSKSNEIKTYTANNGIFIGIAQVAAEKMLEMMDEATAALEVVLTHEGKNGGGKFKSPKSPRGTAGELTKQPNGKGSVPKTDRPKPRMPNKSAQKEQYNADGGKCRNCGNETPIEETTQHHYPKRHADGGSETVTTCKTCHEEYLHKK